MEEVDSKYPKIYDAIKSGDWQRLSGLFVQYPETVQTRAPGFGTWLHYAASFSTLDVVKYLISIGFAINAADEPSGGLMPLVGAALKNKPDIAEYLLDHGAIMDTSDTIRNPLFGAIIGDSYAIARMLLERGIDSTVRYSGDSMDGMDAAAFACEKGRDDILKLIADWQSDGDQEKAKAIMAKAEAVVLRNNRYAAE